MPLLFGRYEYLKDLGAGATGRVLLVRDHAANNAERAIKTVPAEHAAWLSWEFARLSSLVHPRLARVHELLKLSEPAHELGLGRGSVLLVEEYVPGDSWGQIARSLSDGPQRERALYKVALGVAEALVAVHDAGLVHGDVKPANVLVDRAGEARLIDFGFARAPSPRATPKGTPRTMAPELYAGVLGHAADVYALGASLYDVLGGSAASSGPLRTFPALPGLSEPLLGLVRTLTRADPLARPADGREALSALLVVGRRLGYEDAAEGPRYALSAPARTPAALARRARMLPFVPTAGLLEELRDRILGSELVAVRGPAGSGRTRLVREALRLCSEQWLSADATFTWVDSLSAAARVDATRVAVVLDPAGASELAEAARLGEAFRLSGRQLRVVGICDENTPAGEFMSLALRRASDAELGRLAARLLDRDELPAPLLAALRVSSDGWPGRLCCLVAEACALGRPLDPAAYAAPLPEHGDTALGGLSAEARRLLEAAAWAPRLLRDPGSAAFLFAAPAGAAQAFAELVEHGHVRLEAGVPQLPFGLARKLRAQGRAVAALAFAELDGRTTAERSGHEQWLFGRLAAASTAWLREARTLRAAQRGDEAAALLDEALTFRDDPALRLELADLERARARPAAALAALAELHDDEARLARAELLRLSGQRQDAARTLETPFSSAALAERAGALVARLAFDAGDLAAGRSLAAAVHEAGDAQARTRGREVEVLAALARGEPDLALAEQLLDAAQAEGSPRVLGRALALRSQVLAAGGQRAQAQVDARRALAAARAAGEALETATFSLNLGLLEFEAGELGRALEALDEAAYRLCLLERPQDLSRVLFNLGNVALFIGDQARAEVVLEEALARLGERPDTAARALTRLAWAELCLGRGALDEALATLETALAELPDGRAGLRALLLARSCQVLLGKDALALAAERLAAAETLDVAGDVSAAVEVAIAGIRTALARGAGVEAEQRALFALSRFEARLALPDRVRLLLAASDAARAAGMAPLAAQRLALCRALLEQVLSGLSPRQRATLRALPAHARVLEGARLERGGEPAGSAGRFRTLLRRARRLFTEESRARLLARAAELLLELVHAERALVIMTRDGDATLRVAAHADLLGQGAERGREQEFSRSVVERALSEQAPVVTLEAASDARFDTAQSLHRTSVRSVLCVPLPGLPEPAALYLDDRMRGSAFAAEDAALAEDLALLLAQALRALAARQSHERRARRAEQARTELEGELRLLRAGATSAPRLVYASAAMGRLLELARRVAASDVPILITGESGTGKELIARFVHDESTRRAGPFVAESCAALPESLLESALFGHVKGAFSGADRARKGLFELADGGSLLLDEVGEMSPALQAKLLRVLQEGELRPLGSERTRKVDVRVLAATHRDLAALVSAGSFREDLYYRLAVVSLDVPPLRERQGDIALLVQHFVQKHAAGRRVTVDPGVLKALEAAPWPGNVRELENSMRRALVLCQGRIELGHVLLQEGASEAPRAAALDLHAQTEQLTRTLVEQALGRAGGNLTQAAELLGVSRFGLQKMVKRFGLGPYLGRQRK